MSSIKTTQLDGDVSVGRNVAMGGDAEIAGRVHIGHNLKVDGWLDAPNIISGNKGVFLTLDALRAAYPEPRDGWLAGVGASTPFSAYTGIGGEWVATGGTIDITVGISEIEQLQKDVEKIVDELKELDTKIDAETSVRTASITEEASARESADAALQQSITEETTVRQQADASEKTARETADATLQQAIDTEKTAREDAITAEQQARQQADNNLNNRIRIIPSTGVNAVSQKGTGSVATGEGAMAVGSSTQASGTSAFAEGHDTKATGANSHAEGTGSEASNGSAHAEGYQCKASGDCSHAEGFQTTASGHQAHAGGIHSRATAQAAFAHGDNTLAENPASAAFGKFNKSTTGKTLFAVGAGTSDSNRRNVFEVQEDGNILIHLDRDNISLQSVCRELYGDIQSLEGELQDKQDTLTFDDSPTRDSINPVTSTGIQKALADTYTDLYNKIQERLTTETFDDFLADEFEPYKQQVADNIAAVYGTFPPAPLPVEMKVDDGEIPLSERDFLSIGGAWKWLQRGVTAGGRFVIDVNEGNGTFGTPVHARFQSAYCRTETDGSQYIARIGFNYEETSVSRRVYRYELYLEFGDVGNQPTWVDGYITVTHIGYNSI